MTNDQKLLRGAIIGFGNAAAKAHLPALRAAPGLDIVAVVDPSAEKLAWARQLLPRSRVYGSVDELLAQEHLDFVDICTPPVFHGDIVTQAASRGIHVLCEKPLALSLRDYHAITTLAAAHDLTVFTAHNWKYAPLFRTLKDLLQQGEIGKPSFLELCHLRSGPAGMPGTWRLNPALAGAGILVDHGWHALYLTLFLLEESPLAISTTLEQRRFAVDGIEDTATCSIEFPQARAHIFLTWAASERRNAGRVCGEKGEIHIADDKLVVEREGRGREISFPQALSAASYHPDWFFSLLEDFRREMLDPSFRGVNLQEAGLCLQLTMRAYQSHHRHSHTMALTS